MSNNTRGNVVVAEGHQRKPYNERFAIFSERPIRAKAQGVLQQLKNSKGIFARKIGLMMRKLRMQGSNLRPID
jgi:hypothetical protein